MTIEDDLSTSSHLDTQTRTTQLCGSALPSTDSLTEVSGSYQIIVIRSEGANCVLFSLHYYETIRISITNTNWETLGINWDVCWNVLTMYYVWFSIQYIMPCSGVGYFVILTLFIPSQLNPYPSSNMQILGFRFPCGTKAKMPRA